MLSSRASNVLSRRPQQTELERPVFDRDPLAALAAAHDCVADLSRSVTVLERRAVRCDLAVVCDCSGEVVQLVHERLAPADDVSRRPPVLPPGMVRLRDEHGLEAACAIAVVPEDLEL